jgi:hypothetical protein
MADSFIVSRDDYDELSRFLGAFPDDSTGEVLWRRRFNLWWEANPSFGPETPRGWVLKNANGKIVGFLGNIPRRFRASGKDVRGYCATTWRVLPEFRNSSVQLYAEHLKAGAGTFLFNTTPNQSVVKVLDYLKYQSMAASRSGQTYLLPINPSTVSGTYFQHAGMSSILSALGSAALRNVTHVPNALLTLKRDGKVRLIEGAMDYFDGLWNRTQDSVAYTSVRTSDQIAWMCFGEAARRKTVFGFLDDRGLEAFATFRDSEWRGLRVLEAFDMWPASAQESVVSALLAGARDHARQSGYDLLMLHDYSEGIASLLRKVGLMFRTPNPARQFYKPTASDSPAMTAANSYLTGIDGDAGL